PTLIPHVLVNGHGPTSASSTVFWVMVAPQARVAACATPLNCVTPTVANIVADASSPTSSFRIPASPVSGPPSSPRDVSLHHFAGRVVVVLHRGRLHEVGGRSQQGPAQAPVLGQLGAAHGVDDDAGRVGGVPHL